MAFLLDTHALIWWWASDPRLSISARQMVADPDTTVYVSAASAWEIATKVRSGRLPEMETRIEQFNEGVREYGFIHLNVHHEHGVLAGSMPGDHRDPFDRLLAAQALIGGFTMITRDTAFAVFGCRVVW